MLVQFSHRFLSFACMLILCGCTTSAGPSIGVVPAERQWAARLEADDPQIRSTAERELIQGGAGSLPILRRFLRTQDGNLQAEAFEIIRCLGPQAIPLLTEMLHDHRAGIRQQAVSILIDLAPDTESVQRELSGALSDTDPIVAGDAARALGALGEKALPSVPSLIAALSHEDLHVRIYAAEALASVGPGAVSATEQLVRTLRDPVPGIRWAACEALASIGPTAAPAVPQLIESLKDEFVNVRICAAGALGAMGPKASAAAEPLKQAATDPALHAEAEWALERIAGADLHANADPRLPDALVDATPAQAIEAPQGNPPVDWDATTARNIAWSVPLGGESFGRPVVAGGVVYVGTGNQLKLNPTLREECGVLAAFRAKDGEFLWQDASPRVERGTRDFLLPSTTSAALVEGNRLYYVTAECQLRCLDTGHSHNGPDNRQLWELDMCARLGVFVHESANSEVLPIGDLLIVCTSNGRNEGHTRVPSPRAPSIIAVEKRSGNVVWRANGPGEHVLHGQWCSPAAANVGGRTQVLFGGGDGWLRGYDATSGREIWRFDGNPKDARRLPRPGVFSRNPIIASPVYADGRVFVAMGDDPSHGNGPSLVHAISPNGQGDVTDSRCLWTSRQVGRVVGTPIVKDGLLYLGDLGGTVYCLDAATGALVWKHNTDAAIWGCLSLAGGRIYSGNVDGVMTVLRAGRRKEVLARIDMEEPLYSRPAVIGNAMYLATARRLYLIAAKP